MSTRVRGSAANQGVTGSKLVQRLHRATTKNRPSHAGDLGEHNWIGDKSIKNVEILLQSWSSDHSRQYFDLQRTRIDDNDNDDNGGIHEVVLVHIPGHSPGSIALQKWPISDIRSSSSDKKAPRVLFLGDTYSYMREGGHMSGFPQFGNDPRLQSKILSKHTHPRSTTTKKTSLKTQQTTTTTVHRKHRWKLQLKNCLAVFRLSLSLCVHHMF